MQAGNCEALVLDIGFSELVIIGMVALVVIGPERLPRVARTAGHLLGRFQRYVAQVKSDINQEMELAELRNLKSTVEEAARSFETSVKSEMQSAEQELRSAEDELKKAEDEIKQSAAIPFPSTHMGTQHAQTQPAEGAVSVADTSGGVASAKQEMPGALQPQPTDTSSADKSAPQLELGLEQSNQATSPKQG